MGVGTVQFGMYHGSMGYTTTQATELKDALRGLGLRSRATKKRHSFVDADGKYQSFRITEKPADFHVKTDGDGRKGWGEAFAILYTPEAIQAVRDNAEKLAEQGLTVTIYVQGGEFKSIGVVRGWNKPGVRTYDYERKEWVA